MEGKWLVRSHITVFFIFLPQEWYLFKDFFFVTEKVVRLGPVLSSDGWNILIDMRVLLLVLEYLWKDSTGFLASSTRLFVSCRKQSDPHRGIIDLKDSGISLVLKNVRVRRSLRNYLFQLSYFIVGEINSHGLRNLLKCTQLLKWASVEPLSSYSSPIALSMILFNCWSSWYFKN